MKKCANCGHVPHPDASCNTQGCDCSSYAEADGTPDGKATGASMAEEDIPSDSSSASSNSADLATDVDTHLDAAIVTLKSIDAGAALPAVQEFIGSVHSADSSIDQVCKLLGVDDPDEVAFPDPGADPEVLTRAASSAIKQAITSLGDSPSSGPLTEALADVTAADTACDSLLSSFSASSSSSDSDESNTDDPDDAAGDMSTQFADAPAPDPSGNDELPPPPAESAPVPVTQTFTMPIMVLEGVDTGDGRYIQPEVLTWRELPLPVMAITETGFGHDGAQLVGHITAIERFDASSEVNPKTGEAYGTVSVPDPNGGDPTEVPVQGLKATGEFASIDIAETVAQLIGGQFLNGVSVDLSDVVSEIELLDESGEPQGDEEMDLLDALFFGGDMREVVTEGRVMGATICPFPAFEGAYIVLGDGTDENAPATPALQASAKPSESKALRILDEFGSRDCEPCQNGQPLVASAGPMAPPAAWFTDPELDDITPLTVTDDGRVFGHLAAWGSCHTGVSGRCVTPPKSYADYAYFQTGAVRCSDGSLAPVGHLTLGTGHADLRLSPQATLAHYDNTGTAVADVSVGEDAYGVWFSGALRPDVTDLQVRQLQASALSGDWRMLGGHLELLAALSVNVPGYPIPRTRARVASGATLALTAAGSAAVVRDGTAPDLKLAEWQETLEQGLASIFEREKRALRTKELSTRKERLRRRVRA